MATDPESKQPDPGGETCADTPHINAMESDPEFFRDPMIGRVLGKCKIEKLLGEGKTAVVYRAHYLPLNRTVAVKVLQEHMKKLPAVVRVFQQEGRAVAAMDHENILKIYDVGEDDGHHYLVLELLEGRDLLHRIEQEDGGGIPLEEALDYVRQVARGLSAAQRKKLIHRDIKPQNLVVEPDGTLKIVDFGLAAEAEGAFAGGRLGTPHYMSPEVCKGEKAQTASDVYALGITFFHMLVGHPPYSGLHTTEEIVAEHLKGERLRPERLGKGVPRKVAELIRRMTRMDPKARPTAKQILDQLDDLTPKRMAAKRAVKRARARPAARQKPPPAAALVLGGVGLLVVVFVLMRGGGDPEEPVVPEKPPAPVVPEKPEVAEKKRIDRALEREIVEILRKARKETDVKEALGLYQRVITKAPAWSRYYSEAKRAGEALRKRIDAERKKPRVRPLFNPRTASRDAGREFARRESEFHAMLSRLEFKKVRAEIQKLYDWTKEGSAERGAIEAWLDRLRYLESLFGVAAGRAHALEGGKELWNSYDIGASPDLIVIGATSTGIEFRDRLTKREWIEPWGKIRSGVLVKFLDQLRNPKSASESLWLGYLCHVIGDPRADQYLDFAIQLDDSADTRREVKSIRGK